eukprot:1972678-Karenia_brevis.AAC.1
MTFPIGTGLGCDNVSPRAMSRLPDTLLNALGRILRRCEKLGRWPRCVCLVLIVLLAKPDGGRRPIGLLPTVVRIWARAR